MSNSMQASKKQEAVADNKADTLSRKEKTVEKTPIYSVQEFYENAASLGAGYSPESVAAAFRVANKKEATTSEAIQIVSAFLKREVK